MTIRQCDSQDRLKEISLAVDVLQNTVPRFVEMPVTAFTVGIDEKYTYDFPDVSDLEQNADWEILIEPFVGYNEFFPTFMTGVFDNTRLIFDPAGNQTLANSTSFFKIVLKEKGEGALSFPYYCTVYVECSDFECTDSTDGQTRQDQGTSDDPVAAKIQLFEVSPVDPLG